MSREWVYHPLELIQNDLHVTQTVDGNKASTA
jgi:hypothetical protein